MKKIRITESQLERLSKMNLSEGEMPMDEFDYRRMHQDDDMQMLRDAIDKNKMVSVAFVKKDGTVKHMLIRKNLSSYVPSDREKTDAQMNVEMNNDIKKVVDVNAYKREISQLRRDNPEMGGDEIKMMAAKKAWRSINLKNVLGFMVSGQFVDLRDENDILGRYGEEVNNSLTQAMINALNAQEPNVEDDVAPEEVNEGHGGATCSCGSDCVHCGGHHNKSEVGSICKCCDSKIVLAINEEDRGKINEDISRMRTMMGLLNEDFFFDDEENPWVRGQEDDENKDENPWEDMPELPENIQANRVKGTTSADGWLDYILMKLDYKRDNDYNRTKKMFLTMDEKSQNVFEKLVDWKVGKLYDTLLHDVRGVSDDGFSDLAYDIVSRGSEFFNKVMGDPSIAQKMVDDRDYSESFSYTFNEL